MGGSESGVEPQHTDLYNIEVKTIRGEAETIGKYRGKVLLIVNIAQKCGFTPQLKGLEALYQKHKESGLEILGFPSNDFMGQEPGSNEQIAEACSLNYGVTFPLFEKIHVKGPEQHQLYAFLTSKKTNPKCGDKIGWNFNKFLVGADGTILAHIGSRTDPSKLDAPILEALKQVSSA